VHVTRMGRVVKIHTKVLVGKPLGKYLHGISRRNEHDNIKIEQSCEGERWM
jgi:hypothetical protein